MMLEAEETASSRWLTLICSVVQLIVSRFLCCVLLALSWKTTKSENQSTDMLSWAINYLIVVLEYT